MAKLNDRRRALMSAKFEDRVVLVAGGTGGLGRAVTRAFLEERAQVVVTYRALGEFDALKSAAGAKGSRLEGHAGGVTGEGGGRQLVGKNVGEYRRLGAMGSNVGGYVGGT